MRCQYLKVSVVICFVILGFGIIPAPASESSDGTEWVEGSLLLAWGTPAIGGTQAKAMAASLVRDDGSRVNLELGEEQLSALGGPMAVHGRRVRIQFRQMARISVGPSSSRGHRDGWRVVNAEPDSGRRQLPLCFADVQVLRHRHPAGGR